MISIKKVARYADIKQAWNDIWDKSSTLSIYQSPGYSKAVFDHFFPYSIILGSKIVFFAVYDNEVIKMIIPLFKKIGKEEYNLYGYKTGCGYLDLIYDDTINDEQFRDYLCALKKEHGIQSINLNHIRAWSPFGQWLIKTQKNLVLSDCIKIEFPDSFDCYYNSLSKNMRQNIRTAYNRLKRSDLYKELKVIKYSEIDSDTKNKLLKIYIDRQYFRYSKGNKVALDFFTRHIDIGTKAPIVLKDKAKAFIFYINGNIAAYFDALYEKNGIIIPRLAIDEKYHEFSPGILLIFESIKYMLDSEQFIKYIDLTHDSDSYKLSMGGVVRHCIDGELFLEAN